MMFELVGLDRTSPVGAAGPGVIALRFKVSGSSTEQYLEVGSFGELVIVAKAAAYPWDILRNLLRSLSNRRITSAELDELSNAYSHLSESTARAALEYYRLREPTGCRSARHLSASQGVLEVSR